MIAEKGAGEYRRVELGSWLEHQLGSELNLTGTRRAVILANLRCGVAEVRIADDVVWLRKLSSVKHIIELEAGDAPAR